MTITRTSVRLGAVTAAAALAITATTAPAGAHVGVTWDAPQPPQLGKSSYVKLVVPHGCSFTDASLTTPATGQSQTTLAQLGLGSAFRPVAVPGHVTLTDGVWQASTTSMEVAVPQVNTDAASTAEWLGVNKGGLTAEFKPGSGWSTDTDETSTAGKTLVEWSVDTTRSIAAQDSALPYHENMQFGIRMRIETRKDGAGAYLQPTTSQPTAYNLATNKLMLVTKQGCEVDFTDGSTTVRKTIYAGDLVNGWTSSSPTLTVGLDPSADLTRGPAGPEGPAGQDGTDGTPVWGGEFNADLTGTGKAATLTLAIDAARAYVRKAVVVTDAEGATLLRGRLDASGDLDAVLRGKGKQAVAAVRSLEAGDVLTLTVGKKAGTVVTATL